ncbi:hypothetical protein [Planococcus shenhongbingii]|uniref:DUF2834 domain-containing protein n=1 Tax=Planococcus shenhongbingii TaxID=3058398 RepID=A0ABT8NBA5_9BACL|nr:hypothetical protein [Planococcus sp. N017]MDN7245171.1 hypothetical protein [Planococcus sp. N017]
MIFLFIWLVLIGYAAFLAPGEDLDPVFSNILSGQWDNIDPLVFAVFNSLGLFPLVFLTILLLHDRQRWPAWPFALLSLGIGAFSLLPYFAFGDRPAKNRSTVRTPRWLMQFLSSRFWLLVLMVMWASILLTLLQGFSLEAYRDAFFSSSLVSVMTVDWFVLWGLSVYAVNRYCPKAKAKGLAWIPILGPLLVMWVNKKKSS